MEVSLPAHLQVYLKPEDNLIKYLGLHLPQLIDRRRGYVYYIRPRFKEEDQSLGTPHRTLR